MSNILNKNLTSSRKPTYGLLTLFKILSAYPLFWTLGILLGGFLQSQPLVMFVMLTWMIAFYIGAPTWLGLLIYLSDENKITVRQALLYVLFTVSGIILAYFVAEYDILASGVKYID